MASRYGRKKRRQHRERIAELERESQWASSHAKAANDKLYELQGKVRDWNGDTLFLLGKFSAFLSEPGKLLVDRLMGQMYPHKQPNYAFEPEGYLDMDTMSIRPLILHTFRCMCHDDLDRLATLVRFYQVKQDTKEPIYTVGQDLANIMCYTKGVDHGELAFHIAGQILRHLEGQKKA